LEMRDKVVNDVMTPLESVFMLEHGSRLDRKTMNSVGLTPLPLSLAPLTASLQIIHQGHSRVPVYVGVRDNIVGMLLVKRLIHLDPDDCTPIATLDGATTPPPSCVTTMPLFDLLNQFQTGRSHLFVVYRDGEDGSSEPQLVGIITLEDVIEELIGEEIVDETDLYVDVHKRIAVARARLQFHRQSVSAPPLNDTSNRKHIRNRHRWQRSMSQEQLSPRKSSEAAPQSGSVPARASELPPGLGQVMSGPGRVMSVVAEVEERSPQTTPNANERAGLIQREESTRSVDLEDDDTLPLI
jgi:hypothetical protein